MIKTSIRNDVLLYEINFFYINLTFMINKYKYQQTWMILQTIYEKIDPAMFGKIAKNKIHARIMHNPQYIFFLKAGPTI